MLIAILLSPGELSKWKCWNEPRKTCWKAEDCDWGDEVCGVDFILLSRVLIGYKVGSLVILMFLQRHTWL